MPNVLHVYTHTYTFSLSNDRATAAYFGLFFSVTHILHIRHLARTQLRKRVYKELRNRVLARRELSGSPAVSTLKDRLSIFPTDRLSIWCMQFGSPATSSRYKSGSPAYILFLGPVVWLSSYLDRFCVRLSGASQRLRGRSALHLPRPRNSPLSAGCLPPHGNVKRASSAI